MIAQSSSVTGRFDYKPFGGILWQSGTKPRRTFIDREEDTESGLGEFEARKYEDESGRFNSIDEKWEEFRSWSPYHYSSNNPLVIKDPSGKVGGVVVRTKADIVEEGWSSGGGAASFSAGLTIGAVAGAIWYWLTSDGDAGEEKSKTAAPSSSTSKPDGKQGDEKKKEEKKEDKKEPKKEEKQEREWRQDKKLSDGEIKKLKDKGHDIHKLKEEIVGRKQVSRYDIYKNRNGDLYLKPKGGQGAGEPLNVNINN